MNNKFYFLISFTICTLMSGCTSSNGLVIEDGPPPSTSGERATSGTYSVPPQSDFNLDLQLGNENIDALLRSSDPLPTVRFTVWAYDQIVADVSATQVKVEEFPLRPQAAAYPLRFSREDLQVIEYQSDAEDAVRYYVTLVVDVDHDGEACNGDYRQDASVSRPEFFPLTRTNVEKRIEIAEIRDDLCG